jgi:hypothetical protein
VPLELVLFEPPFWPFSCIFIGSRNFSCGCNEPQESTTWRLYFFRSKLSTIGWLSFFSFRPNLAIAFTGAFWHKNNLSLLAS